MSDEHKLNIVHRSQQGLNQHPGIWIHKLACWHTRQTDVTHGMPAILISVVFRCKTQFNYVRMLHGIRNACSILAARPFGGRLVDNGLPSIIGNSSRKAPGCKDFCWSINSKQRWVVSSWDLLESLTGYGSRITLLWPPSVCAAKAVAC